jgi:hypothetical protein
MSDTPVGRFTIRFEETTIEVEPGQTLAAALIAAGIRSWRTTRVAGAPRGVFCGIGVCFDCLATVNRRPNVRACLEEAHPGDVVTTQQGTGRDALAL